jgi:hypothetical protein
MAGGATGGASASAPAASAPAASSPGAPSAAVTALNAQRAANVAAGVSAYTGTAASLASFTSANPTVSTKGGTGGGPEPGFNADGTVQAPTSGGGTVIAPGVTNFGATKTSSASPIVTSNQSRVQYANNVNDLNDAISHAGTTGVSIVDYLNKSGMPSDYNSRAALAANNGITGYTGTAVQNLQLLNILQNGGPAGNNGNANPTNTNPTNTSTTNPTSTTSTSGSATGTTTPVTAPDPSATGGEQGVVGSDGNITYPDGTVTDSSGNVITQGDPTYGLPPALASEYKATLAEQDQAIQNAQETLTQASNSMSDDPAAAAALAQVQSQYGILISNMQTKNQQVLGKAGAEAAAFGGLGAMPTTFMSDEMDAASTRLAGILNDENEALLKSSTAYQAADVKAFNDAQTALNTAQNDKKATLATLLSATQKEVTQQQAQQKIDAANTKAALASDVTMSAKIAAGMVVSLQEAGITDPAQIASYVQAMATANGIQNADILAGALATAQAAATKANVTNAHTNAETVHTEGEGSGTTTKVKGGTDGTYTYTPADLTTYSTLLTKGGTINGQKYNGQGSDSYYDPGAYTAVFNDWIKNGGTAAGFLKKYPIKNVNPASYSELPAAIQPKSSSSSSYTA